jgi:hypothetical protein
MIRGFGRNVVRKEHGIRQRVREDRWRGGTYMSFMIMGVVGGERKDLEIFPVLERE